MTNLLNSFHITKTNGKKKVAPWKRRLVYLVVFFILLLLALLVWALFNIANAKAAVASGLAAKQSFEYAQVAIGDQDFEQAKIDLQEARQHFVVAQEEFAAFRVFKAIPYANRQVLAVERIMEAGTRLADGLYTLAGIGEQVNAVIAEEGKNVSFGDVTPEDKAAVLKALAESTVELQSVRSDIELAVLAIEDIPDEGLLEPVREAVVPIKEQLPLLEGVITQAIPLAQSLPSILGYPEEKTYLFLLQNNNELRPTGGFIGTYGILVLNSGEIQKFFTDNIYNLDNQAKDTITEPSPLPIAQHTSTQNWLLRNINWSPHFPETAQKAISKYYEEGGEEVGVDGVIAVTPDFIASLLELTGPITIENIEFKGDTFQNQLQYESQIGFAEDGLDDSQRKDVIGALATQLLDQLFGLPRSEFASIWEAFRTSVDEKEILIYIENPITQQLIVEQNWAGEMKAYESDTLMVVDANLAALKTDDVMQRNITYSVAEEDGELVGTMQMKYFNDGQFDVFHTRYRTWTRVYIPHGAEVIEANGFVVGDNRNRRDVPAEVYEEQFREADDSVVPYTVVAGFLSIEPKESRTLTIKYKLPDSIKKQVRDGRYTLSVQKQPGTDAHGLVINFDIGREIIAADPLDKTTQSGENTVSINTDLLQDRIFEIDLK